MIPVELREQTPWLEQSGQGVFLCPKLALGWARERVRGGSGKELATAKNGAKNGVVGRDVSVSLREDRERGRKRGGCTRLYNLHKT